MARRGNSIWGVNAVSAALFLGAAFCSPAFADIAPPVLPSADQANLNLQSADDRLEINQPAILRFRSDNEAKQGGTTNGAETFQRASSATVNNFVPSKPALADATAQSAPAGPEPAQPIDLTPVQLPERGPQFTTFNTFQTAAMYRLPSKMFFSAICDNSLRLETNVYQTAQDHNADMVYRVLPNVLAGYALTNRTRVAANYFYFRDQYTLNQGLSRNINSIGMRIDHDIPINEKTTLTTGFFGRALLTQLNGQSEHTLSDLIPSVVLTRRCGYANVIYGSVLGQVRFRNVLGEFQEGDQFYSVGTVIRKRPYVIWIDLTLDSNFGITHLRGGHNNQVLILTMEVARRIHPRLPISVFIQSQPIFNMGANSSPGYAGFNYRLFGGIRAELAKPAIFPVKLSQK